MLYFILENLWKKKMKHVKDLEKSFEEKEEAACEKEKIARRSRTQKQQKNTEIIISY